jgi:hypothetical protein
MGLSAGAAFLSRGGDLPAAQDRLGVADHDQDRGHLRAVVLLFKIIIATACAMLLFGTLWLFTAIFTL